MEYILRFPFITSLLPCCLLPQTKQVMSDDEKRMESAFQASDHFFPPLAFVFLQT